MTAGNSTTPHWQPYREPLRATLVRTVTIAVIAGAILTLRRGDFSRWPLATLLVLWPSFGGHWVELWYLNWLRPRLPATRVVQIAARVLVWFVGGIALAFGMYLTAMLLVNFRPAQWPAWWIGGLVFIGIELIVHVIVQMRGRSNFYNGRS